MQMTGPRRPSTDERLRQIVELPWSQRASSRQAVLMPKHAALAVRDRVVQLEAQLSCDPPDPDVKALDTWAQTAETTKSRD